MSPLFLRRSSGGACLVVCSWLSACAGTETGNPSFVGKLGYDAYTSAPSVVALTLALEGPADSLVTVDSAWLVLGDVELQSGTECDNERGAHVDIAGLGAGDHATGQAPPTEFEGAPGKYCGVTLPFAPARAELPKGAPESLETESVLLAGKLPDGRAYEIHSRLQESLSLHATAGDFVLDEQHQSVVIGFDVAHWLSELRWQDATATPDGTVVVSETSNPALLQQFEAALPSGVALFRDQDGNGQLDTELERLAVIEP